MNEDKMENMLSQLIRMVGNIQSDQTRNKARTTRNEARATRNETSSTRDAK